MQADYTSKNKLESVSSRTGEAKKSVAIQGSRDPFIVPVSAVLITYNEESVIAETLSKLSWCDEIVIVDSGSTDKTLDICRQFGCRIFSRPFSGFGDQKKFAVSKAVNDWILCIDADEVLTKALVNEIRHELHQADIRYAAFSVPRTLVFMKKVFRYGKETGSYVTRLFNRTRGNWNNAFVHESVEVNGPVKKLKGKILHYSYHSYNQFLGKINLYSTLGAKKLQHRPVRKSRSLVILAIPFNFFRYYILHRNFMNGYRGFSWSVLNTFYHFIKYLKAEENRR
jgi:glycosyltransferase involved in cell wall biosynthesis